MKRPWLLPLTPLWAAGTAWKNHAFERDTARVKRLQRPVISVGSLSAGGAGKTPFVIALGEVLLRNGVRCDVLSRGYGRTMDTANAKRVNPKGSADEFGDEPLLISRTLKAPVYVASRRMEAGRLAEADAANHAKVHLLDDGFQHRQLARTLDIVLVTEQDLRDTLLPAGDLREPLHALRRADILVVRAEEMDGLRPALARVFETGSLPPVWQIERRFEFVGKVPSTKPLAFCGIARPQGFLDALQASHVRTAGLVALRDHQRYDHRTIQRLVRRAAQQNADGFVTTAKDAVKLSSPLRALLEKQGPLAVADIRVRLTEEQACLQMLVQRLADASSA